MSWNLYWGDLHSHCSISYGHGTVSQALQRAAQQLDFCSITGHAFWPDMPTDRERYGPIIDYHHEGFARLAGNWNRLLDEQAASSREGRFIALPSYEWHSMEFGDHNIYSPGPDLELYEASSLPSLRSVLEDAGQKAIAIPHHIGYRQGYRGINWDAFDATRSPFVEIFSLHGCSISGDSAYPMLHDMGPRDAHSLADFGWDQGHRFGIVAGTDHHAAYPGSHGDGRMGVYATELTRESLWEAFLARRVFAATGDPIDARMWIDDAFVGESVQSGKRRRVRIRVRGLDAIRQVNVIKNGRVIRSLFPLHTDPRDSQVFQVRLVWGWGRQNEIAQWNANVRIDDGNLLDAVPCFSGQSIVAPDSGEVLLDTMDLPHEIVSRDDAAIEWKSLTTGNRTMRHATTQALSLRIDGSVGTRLTVHVNGQSMRYRLSDLIAGPRSHFLRGWLSEAIQIGPVRTLTQCEVDAAFDDECDRPVDVYRLEVEQCNGQWAWVTPIWVEQ